MKFHCERCKTRYSISEERVRGKILKIRCKNCAAVITVREGMDAAPGARAASRAEDSAPPQRASAAARPGALAGAFAEALSRPREPAADDSLSNAPATLDAEWYLSVDGEQEGPLTLEAARRWVSARGPDDELYCWSEGFDEWLTVDKVSHFRNLRGGAAPASSRPDSGFDEDERTVIDPGQGHGGVPAMTPVEETPKPLFAATMAAVESEAPTVASEERLPDPLFKPPPGFGSAPSAGPRAANLRPAQNGVGSSEAVDGGDLDFDIGEASRVVKLPLLARGLAGSGAAGQAPAAPRSSQLPGMGARPPSEAPLDPAMITAGGDSARPELLAPQGRSRRNLLLPLVAAGALAVGGAAVLLMTVGGGDGDDDGGQIARGTVGGGGNLGFTFQEEREAAEGEGEGEPRSEKRARSAQPPRRGTARDRSSQQPKSGGTVRRSSPSFDEVDLSGGGSQSVAGPLDGDDLMEVYRANQYLVKRCYERALKKDPFLEVSKTWVSISVATSGRVTSVSIPTLRGTELGTCLTAIIKRWRFRESSEVFNSRFPVVFGS